MNVMKGMFGGGSKDKSKAASRSSTTSGEAAKPAPGAKLKFKETYTLGKELGKGNYSTVHLATPKVKGDDDKVAVKVIKKNKLQKEDLDALAIEVAILAQVTHPSIIKYINYFDEGDTAFLVTEVMEGGELFDRIVSKESYSEGEARQVVKTLADCLQYLHSNNVVHRDLKPENILLKRQDDDKDIKIADFGFAQKIPADGCKTACGTPGYVAPEIITGRRYGTSVDVWSLGIIIYILLCGYPPFYHQQQAQLFKQIREGRYEFDSPYWDNISNEAKDLVRICLKVDPAKRATMEGVLASSFLKQEGSGADLSKNLPELKATNAKRKLRAAVKAAVAANRLQEIASSVAQG